MVVTTTTLPSVSTTIETGIAAPKPIFFTSVVTPLPNATAPIKPGVKFDVGVEVQIANWLAFNTMVPEVFIPTLPPDVTCDSKMKRGKDVTVTGRTLAAKFTCSTTVKGAYELRASLRFGYDAPNKATGVGEDTVSWKFEVKP